MWALGTVLRGQKAELDAVLARFPGDITSAPVSWGKGQRAKILSAAESDHNDAPAVQVGAGKELRHQIAAACLVGRYVDEWGSLWEVLEPGLVGEVIEPALADWSALVSYHLPYELLDELDRAGVLRLHGVARGSQCQR